MFFLLFLIGDSPCIGSGRISSSRLKSSVGATRAGSAMISSGSGVRKSQLKVKTLSGSKTAVLQARACVCVCTFRIFVVSYIRWQAWFLRFGRGAVRRGRRFCGGKGVSRIGSDGAISVVVDGDGAADYRAEARGRRGARRGRCCVAVCSQAALARDRRRRPRRR